MNGYVIWQYLENPLTINTIIPVYWVQSVLIGMFNFIDLLTMRTLNDGKEEKGGCFSLFFLVHYGGFHLGYLIFMFIIVDVKQIDWHLLSATSLILLVSMFVNFVRDKMRFGRTTGNPITIMMLPYVRIIPMHLAIIIPAFMHISSFSLFLVLKTACDISCYFLFARYRHSKTALVE